MLLTPPEIYDKHDEMGNSDELLSPEDRKKLLAGDYRRACHLSVCAGCMRLYIQHPQVMGALWLNKLCNGDLVKL